MMLERFAHFARSHVLGCPDEFALVEGSFAIIMGVAEHHYAFPTQRELDGIVARSPTRWKLAWAMRV